MVGKLGGAYIPLPTVTSEINAILGAEAVPLQDMVARLGQRGLSRGLGQRSLDKEKNGRYCQHDRGDCEFLSSRLCQNNEADDHSDDREHPRAHKIEGLASHGRIAPYQPKRRATGQKIEHENGNVRENGQVLKSGAEGEDGGNYAIG